MMDGTVLEGAVMDDVPADTDDQLDEAEQLLVATLPPVPADPAELMEGEQDDQGTAGAG